MAIRGVDPRDPLPLYYQLYTSLLERIRSGEFAVGDMLPSERQLSRDYGVSRITAIKALDLLEREGYIERLQGRGSFVVERRSSVSPTQCRRVAFCLPTFADSYITSILVGAARAAMRQSFQLQVIGVESEESEAKYIREAVEQGVEGMLVFPRADYPDLSLYEELVAQHYPIVLLDRYYPDIDTNWVAFADETAAYELTELLIERGHRRIAVFPGHEVSITSVRDRLQGYRRALEDHGLEYDEELVCLDVYDRLAPPSLYRLRGSYRELFRRMQYLRFTGVVAINMYVAWQIAVDLMKIKNVLLRAVVDGEGSGNLDGFAPEMVAIASRLFAHDQASLMAIAVQDGERLGEQGISMLMAQLQEGGEASPSRHLRIPMEVIRLNEGSRVRPSGDPAERTRLDALDVRRVVREINDQEVILDSTVMTE